MNRILDAYELPKLNQEDTKILNNSVTGNEIEVTLKILLTNKSPGLDEFTAEFYKNFS